MSKYIRIEDEKDLSRYVFDTYAAPGIIFGKWRLKRYLNKLPHTRIDNTYYLKFLIPLPEQDEETPCLMRTRKETICYYHGLNIVMQVYREYKRTSWEKGTRNG